jgi:hypothetical protein
VTFILVKFHHYVYFLSFSFPFLTVPFLFFVYYSSLLSSSRCFPFIKAICQPASVASIPSTRARELLFLRNPPLLSQSPLLAIWTVKKINYMNFLILPLSPYRLCDVRFLGSTGVHTLCPTYNSLQTNPSAFRLYSYSSAMYLFVPRHQYWLSVFISIKKNWKLSKKNIKKSRRK